jgi:hypothetical protein
MASYWIVVPRGNAELFDLLSVAFRGRSGFSVIMDRRSGDSRPKEGERRGTRLELGPDEIIVAERAGRTAKDRENSHGSRRPAVRRGSSRRSDTGGSQASAAEPRFAFRDNRLFTG